MAIRVEVGGYAMVGAAVIVLGALMLVMTKSGASLLAKKGTKVAVGAAEGVVTGTVEGIGEIFGIPATDAVMAESARKSGDVWEASFAMPAPEFIRWLWNGRNTGGATGEW